MAENKLGCRYKLRVLLDPASTSSYITTMAQRKLGLSRSNVHTTVSGLGGQAVVNTNGATEFQFTNLKNDIKFEVKAYVVPQITDKLPSLPYPVVQEFKELDLADEHYNIPSPINALLGADVYYSLIGDGRIVSTSGLTAFNTALGWAVGGPIYEVKTFVTSCFQAPNLENALTKFWELEEIPITGKCLTTEDELVEKHFDSTHSRDSTGRYVVQLPTREPMPPLGSSRDIAIKRFHANERRMAKNRAYAIEYRKFMAEYEELGHMKRLTDEEVISTAFPIYYIPHHMVSKLDSTTTKFRVVFDASASSSNGVSLNDTMLVGPTLQPLLTTILTRFRIQPIAMSADIAKMYRQILVAREHQDLQRIVWRPNPDEPIRDYRLLTVTYGTGSAPYLAVKVLQTLAIDEQADYPVASRIALDDFYVDDCLTGAATIEEAKGAYDELTSMMQRGGMELRKWSSNSSELLEHIPEQDRELKVLVEFPDDQAIKTLGITWNTNQDWFQFTVTDLQRNSNLVLTKRNILSDIAKLFDPLGWFAPVTVTAKIIMQELWKAQLAWDSPIPENIGNVWIPYRDSLVKLAEITIPRCITPKNGVVSTRRMVGFCDASEKAYAAVVYTVVFTNEEKVISLISAKTKVAPLKSVSLPRLELCGALLLAKLMHSVGAELKLEFDESIAFTDSTITLGWIASNPYKWKTFVANRVAKIQSVGSISQWRHVPGIENPADCASRGIMPSELINHPLWWTGPSWIADSELPYATVQIDEHELELKSVKPVSCIAIGNDLTNYNSLLHRYSSIKTLVKITAWIKRFIQNSRTTGDSTTMIREKGLLAPAELDSAFLVWIKSAQEDVYVKELAALQGGKQLSPKSHILSLNPFLDNKGILRVGGRLANATHLSQERRTPIILPQIHKLTELLIRQAHLDNLHAGPQLLQSILNQRFWIVNARNALRRIIHKCVKCARLRATLSSQQMGDLPEYRVTPSPAFQRCGVDYAGPFILRAIPGRSKVTFKGYLCIFVCMVTRAVHLEVVSSLDTPSFVATLKRFIARRGKPIHMHSDQGSNFVGSEQELKDLISSPQHNSVIANSLSQEGITWHFNPPGAPHMGGIWEAGVKSVKYHLKRVVGETRLTFEELTTLMCQIEACLNSRPVTPMSSDPSDLTALTPGHFLTGGPLVALPEPNLQELPLNRLSRWQHLQRMTQDFWSRWSNEHISRLQQRPKWARAMESLKIGDLVLIKHDNLPPLQWKMGRVIKTHEGQDRLVRVVTLQTSSGVLQRPIHKLCLLPIEHTSN